VRRLVVAALILLTGCSAGQDPGLTPTSDLGPSTTSRTLAACPPGGPDATTPAAGCLDDDGAVLRPG
jgi:hypothetical protein